MRIISKLVLLGLALIATGLAIAAEGPPLTVSLPDLPEGQEMLVLEINLEPGQASAPHRHNAHVFVYVRATLNNSMAALRSLKRSYARRVSPLMAIPLARSATPQMDA